jgi:hypothetical protein
VHVHAVHAGKTFGFRMRFTMVPDYGSSEGAFPGIGDKYRNIVSRQRPSYVSGAKVADAVTDRDRLAPVQSAENQGAERASSCPGGPELNIPRGSRARAGRISPGSRARAGRPVRRAGSRAQRGTPPDAPAPVTRRTTLKRAGALAVTPSARGGRPLSFTPQRTGASIAPPGIRRDISPFLAVPPQAYGSGVQFHRPPVRRPPARTVFPAADFPAAADLALRAGFQAAGRLATRSARPGRESG